MEKIFCHILPVLIDRSNSSVRTGAIECEETLSILADIPSDPEALLVSKAIKYINLPQCRRFPQDMGMKCNMVVRNSCVKIKVLREYLTE